LTIDQRKRVLVLACACDRLELELLHRRHGAAQPGAALGGAARLWTLVGILGRLVGWGRQRRPTSTAGKWLRFASPLLSLFI
jgi:hypothetical protein